jgi:hypothetical protein
MGRSDESVLVLQERDLQQVNEELRQKALELQQVNEEQRQKALELQQEHEVVIHR